VTVTLNNIPTETGDFAIVRSALPDDPQERVFGYTTDRYNILQPLDAVELFDEKVGEPVETLGMLGKGERLFLTWKLPETEVVKDDVVQWYGFCAIGFDGVLGASLNVVTTRVVCQNTWTAAIAEAMQEKQSNKGRIYAGKHTSKNMKFKLGEWMNHVQSNTKKQVELTNSFFKQLTKVPLSNEKEVYRLLFTAYPDPKPLPEDYPAKLRASKEEKLEMDKKLMAQYRDGIYSDQSYNQKHVLEHHQVKQSEQLRNHLSRREYHLRLRLQDVSQSNSLHPKQSRLQHQFDPFQKQLPNHAKRVDDFRKNVVQKCYVPFIFSCLVIDYTIIIKQLFRFVKGFEILIYKVFYN